MTRDIIANFLEESIKPELCERFLLSRKNIFSMFSFYVDYVAKLETPEVKLYGYSENSQYKKHYEQRASLIKALLEYGTEQYVKEVRNDGYYCIEFLVDPLKEPDKWEAFISCVRKGANNVC